MARYDWDRFGRPGTARVNRWGGWLLACVVALMWPGFLYQAVTSDWTLALVPLLPTAGLVLHRIGVRQVYGIADTRIHPMPAELTIEVARISGVFTDDDPHIGTYTYRPVRVPLDEAAELADDLLGGPRVTVALEASRAYFAGRHVVRAWRLTVTAFVDLEAMAAWHQVQDMLEEGSQVPGMAGEYWLRDGELIQMHPVPQSGCPAGTGAFGGHVMDAPQPRTGGLELSPDRVASYPDAASVIRGQIIAVHSVPPPQLAPAPSGSFTEPCPDCGQPVTFRRDYQADMMRAHRESWQCRQRIRNNRTHAQWCTCGRRFNLPLMDLGAALAAHRVSGECPHAPRRTG